MKPVLSVLLIFLLVIVAVHHTSASRFSYKKRFYDNWESTNDLINNKNDKSDGSYQIYPYQQRGHRKDDPCTNKPLWYLKYQARLGKLSPFYDCLSVYSI